MIPPVEDTLLWALGAGLRISFEPIGRSSSPRYRVHIRSGGDPDREAHSQHEGANLAEAAYSARSGYVAKFGEPQSRQGA